MRIQIIRPRGQKNDNGWVEPAIGRCVCGGEVYLNSALENPCESHGCGRYYNLVGQEVSDPNSHSGRMDRADDDRFSDDDDKYQYPSEDY